MRATIQKVEIDSIQNKNGKGTYQKAQVHYISGGKPSKYQCVSFNRPEVFKKITSLAEKDEIEVTMEKEGDFWKWADLEKVAAGSAPANSQAASSNRYETPEERVARQISIVRQSSLASAVNFLREAPNVTEEHVIALAAKFEDFVHKGLQGAVEEGVFGMEDDIPQ